MKQENLHDRILHCRFYNGENEFPEEKFKDFTIESASSYWYYEKLWAEKMYKDDWSGEFRDMRNEGIFDELNDDTSPISLLAILYNRWRHWGGELSPADAFVDWIRHKYEAMPTNFQKRFDKRKSELIKRCHFYNGEEQSPFNEESKEYHFWKYELMWVASLAASYTHADEWRLNLKMYPKIEAFAKSNNLPSSYIGLLVNRDEHWLGRVVEDDFIAVLQKYYNHE